MDPVLQLALDGFAFDAHLKMYRGRIRGQDPVTARPSTGETLRQVRDLITRMVVPNFPEYFLRFPSHNVNGFLRFYASVDANQQPRPKRPLHLTMHSLFWAQALVSAALFAGFAGLWIPLWTGSKRLVE